MERRLLHLLTETELNHVERDYKKAAAFKEYAIRDGRIITGPKSSISPKSH